MNKLKAAVGNTNTHAAEGKQPTTTDISRRGETVRYPKLPMPSFEFNAQYKKMDGVKRYNACSGYKKKDAKHEILHEHQSRFQYAS